VDRSVKTTESGVALGVNVTGGGLCGLMRLPDHPK
ncbi:hypothetical protein LCGC14_2379400, partial [marine sediment metagenome]